jgi:hypothetical protein
MAYDGSARDPDWTAADLDAISATVDWARVRSSFFGQTVRASADKVSFGWTLTADYRAVRGSFATPAGVGSYAVSMSWSGSGTSFVDTAVPRPRGASGTWSRGAAARRRAGSRLSAPSRAATP